MNWPFVKYVGCGNDFIIFDNREGKFPHENKSLISSLCHRQWGIGADGVILLELSQKADFRMRIFNVDGSEAEMCGNGIRCLVHWVHSLAPFRKEYVVESMQRLHHASIQDSEVCIDMGDAYHLKWGIPIKYEGKELLFNHLDTGVPHVVHFNEDIYSIDLQKLGPVIRHHSCWKPQGTNVNLAQRIDHSHFLMRTYERGVENETLGCGTGATAVALAAAKKYGSNSPVIIKMPAGEVAIKFVLENDQFSNITMTGPALCTFHGNINIEATEGIGYTK